MSRPSSRSSRAPVAAPCAATNIVVLCGTVTAAPVHRDLPSGGVVVQFDVRTDPGAAGPTRSVSVPVAWTDPPAAALRPVTAGTEVVVAGTVVRRFFRVGGATQSRTEVVPDAVVPQRRTKQVAALLAAAIERLASS